MLAISSGTHLSERYVADRPLGEGGMAVVWRVRHAQLGTVHAMKVLKVPVGSIQDRLLREGRVQAALQHPNVVSVTDIIDVAGSPGLVMEYIAGPSLDRLLVERRLTLEQADALARGIIKGVAIAHKRGLIHRDLKPANVMLAVQDGEIIPKVTDFGLVKLLETDEGPAGRHKTRAGVAMGTPSYMAPEQIRDASGVDARADVFSVGGILYELVTSTRAFDHPDMLDTFNHICNGIYTPPRELQPELPQAVADVIARALLPDRNKRTPDCATLLEEWVAAMATLPRSPGGPWSKEFSDAVSALGAGDVSTGAHFTLASRDTTSSKAPAARVSRDGTSNATTGGIALLGAVAGGGVVAAVLGVVALLAVVLVIGGLAYGTAPVAAPVVPKPVIVAVPTKAPESVKPEPDAAPEEPEPVATPTPTVAKPAAKPAPRTAKVKFTGEATSVKLVNGSARYGAGDVPAGRYTIEATFPDSGAVDAGKVTINAGQAVTIDCRDGFYRCSPL